MIDEREESLTLPNLTFTQKHRLENLLDFNCDNVKDDISHNEQGQDTIQQSHIAGNTDEIANLIVIAAYSDSTPYRRQEIKQLTNQLFTSSSLLTADIPLTKRRINEIATTAYTQIDKITGKYEEIPA